MVKLKALLLEELYAENVFLFKTATYLSYANTKVDSSSLKSILFELLLLIFFLNRYISKKSLIFWFAIYKEKIIIKSKIKIIIQILIIKFFLLILLKDDLL